MGYHYCTITVPTPPTPHDPNWGSNITQWCNWGKQQTKDTHNHKQNDNDMFTIDRQAQLSTDLIVYQPVLPVTIFTLRNNTPRVLPFTPITLGKNTEEVDIRQEQFKLIFSALTDSKWQESNLEDYTNALKHEVWFKYWMQKRQIASKNLVQFIKALDKEIEGTNKEHVPYETFYDSDE